MFSGIVQTKSEGHESSKTDSGIKLKITSNESFYLNIKKGDSVSVDGVCLTVTDFGKNYAFFDVIPETLRCTNLNEINEKRIYLYNFAYYFIFLYGIICKICKLFFKR